MFPSCNNVLAVGWWMLFVCQTVAVTAISYDMNIYAHFGFNISQTSPFSRSEALPMINYCIYDIMAHCFYIYHYDYYRKKSEI